ncbi:MAG: hypothetical protein K6G09_03365 [Treponema sp.]|nr:hypothetical protein [Treponema sp.]
MKKVFVLIFVFLFIVTRGSTQESSSLEDIEFINYTGPNDVIDSASAIRAIGIEIGKQIVQDKYSSLGNRDRYSVTHAISEETEPEKLNADIFYIGKDASVDHINNLRRIIAGYIEAAYSYSSDDADNISVYITAYNAVYRGQYDFFAAKYKNLVIENLTKENCGLSKNYTEWSGHSEIIIPLKKENKKYSVDSSVFDDRKVISYIEDIEIKEEIEKQLIRYKGLAFEGHIKGSFVTGELADFITALICVGAGLEYTLPVNLPIFDLGFSARAEGSVLLPKKDSLITKGFNITASASTFIRIPFFLGNATAALQPELSYGIALYNLISEYENVAPFYLDQIVSLGIGLRLSLPKVEKLELEFAPQCSLFFEKSNVIMQPGLRLGTVWHFATK